MVSRSIFASLVTLLLFINCTAYSTSTRETNRKSDLNYEKSNRRAFFSKSASIFSLATLTISNLTPGFVGEAQAIGPVKIDLKNPIYSAATCPKDKPIPGQKAMLGMRGLCVTVKADLAETSPKALEKVGIYGFVTDAKTGNSVLANNPDLSTDAGQFAMIESVTTENKSVTFDFVAAIPRDRDISEEENGIGALDFGSLRIISFPGGQQYGAISPCEMNEFSSECEEWENVNGTYEKSNYMVKSNDRTKGR